jgi:4'-phosphopantetheinyl transferase EntD
MVYRDGRSLDKAPSRGRAGGAPRAHRRRRAANDPSAGTRSGYAPPVFRLAAPAPYQTAFCVALPHGLVAGVYLPGADPESASPMPAPVPESVLDTLHPEERAHAATLRGFRQVEFVGGRLALAQAIPEIGMRPEPVLSDPHGAPALPPGVVGSVAHKRDLAVAAVARGFGPHRPDDVEAGRAAPLGIGIDLEDTDRPRAGVAERVLRPEELAAVHELPEARRWVDTVIRFAVKEAVYKALHPFLRRYIGFGEVAVWPTPDGVDRVEPFLADPGGDFVFEARHYWIEHRVLATVRVRPGSPQRRAR